MPGKNYNLTKIKAFIGDDNIMMNKMIDIFLKNAPLMVSKIEESLEHHNYDQVNFYAHKLKSSIDSFSIIQLTDDIRLIEKLTKEKSVLKNLPDLVYKLKVVLQSVIEEIKTDFNKD